MLWILACSDECAEVATSISVTDADGVTISEVKEAPAAYPLRAGSDVTFDWSGVAHDLACFDLDPTTIQHVTLTRSTSAPSTPSSSTPTSAASPTST